MERVFLAASRSSSSIFNSRGVIISRSLRRLNQRHLTPIDSRTSIMRKTSSIRATWCKTVRPRFKRLAQSRPTAAFFEVLMVMVPLKVRPPLTRKDCEEESLIERIWPPSAVETFLIISSEVFWSPFSIRWIADCEVPSIFASWAWVSPFSLRIVATTEPISSW